ncbi:hypothetical protein GQ53DRAFT_473567 [Thozetella sp. PMI_491]|nr:hypothetical protein GQ53DRAFT_473567 [Thozetella sp. PMI_491]
MNKLSCWCHGPSPVCTSLPGCRRGGTGAFQQPNLSLASFSLHGSESYGLPGRARGLGLLIVLHWRSNPTQRRPEAGQISRKAFFLPGAPKGTIGGLGGCAQAPGMKPYYHTNALGRLSPFLRAQPTGPSSPLSPFPKTAGGRALTVYEGAVLSSCFIPSPGPSSMCTCLEPWPSRFKKGSGTRVIPGGPGAHGSLSVCVRTQFRAGRLSEPPPAHPSHMTPTLYLGGAG